MQRGDSPTPFNAVISTVAFNVMCQSKVPDWAGNTLNIELKLEIVLKPIQTIPVQTCRLMEHGMLQGWYNIHLYSGSRGEEEDQSFDRA